MIYGVRLIKCSRLSSIGWCGYGSTDHYTTTDLNKAYKYSAELTENSPHCEYWVGEYE